MNKKPTEMQLGTLYSWLKWVVDQDKAKQAVAWLENNATRRAVSAEMARLKVLKDKQLLDAPKCFTGEIWEGFDYGR